MNKELLDHLKKPVLYQKSSEAFWDDDHISAQMLQAHLSQDTDAASRRIGFIDKSVEWIGRVLPPDRYPRLLDLGCGPGLYCERLYRQGYSVTGYDVSKRSIDYAKHSASEKQLPVRYEQKDYLKISENDQYDICTMIYCDYGALSTSDRKTVLRNIHDMLRPNGVFLFDVFTKEQYRDFVPAKTWDLCEGNGFWKRGPYVELNETLHYEPDIYLHRHIILNDDGISHYLIWDTVFDPETISDELKESGFEVMKVCSDVCGAQYSSDSTTMAVLCRKV